MNANDANDKTGSTGAADQPIGEIATAIERTPPPEPPVKHNPSAVPPIGEIETAIERSEPA